MGTLTETKPSPEASTTLVLTNALVGPSGTVAYYSVILSVRT